MSVILPWLILSLTVLVLAAGVFLWLQKRQGRPEKTTAAAVQPRTRTHLFWEETASEPGIFIKEAAGRAEPLPSLPPLPKSYGVDRLVLLARDPNWLYAYWEITATRQEEFISSYGPSSWASTQPVLRVYDVTGIQFNGYNANSYTDIRVNDFADNWHIEVGAPDRSFCVDLGRMFPDGRFVTLLRSNVVTTPRASLSDRLDEEWMWIEGLYRSIARFQFGVSSPLIAEELNIAAGKIPINISSPVYTGPNDRR